jgi:2-polyprenyl-3-methyl-5-hydroxy-6-metoxy-1,4-benzoquinol methylase
MNYLCLDHDPYGHEKRFGFITMIFDTNNPKTVLDIGCGTGEMLTIPLALKYPHIKFYGVDSDNETIAIAKASNCNSNLKLFTKIEEVRGIKFDIVIASEVIEHVERPYDFLVSLKQHVSKEGRTILTVPNGFGPFELGTLAENILHVSGVLRVIKFFKGRKIANAKNLPKDTVANSPHLNYFSIKQLKGLFLDAGLASFAFKSRTFICGPFFDKLVTTFNLSQWNASVADRLIPNLCSDWMFELRVIGKENGTKWKRSVWANKRRKFNLKRAGLLTKINS